MNSVSGISGNLGDIKLASTRSGGGRSSSGCDAGFGLIALAAVALLVFINSCKRKLFGFSEQLPRFICKRVRK